MSSGDQGLDDAGWKAVGHFMEQQDCRAADCFTTLRRQTHCDTDFWCVTHRHGHGVRAACVVVSAPCEDLGFCTGSHGLHVEGVLDEIPLCVLLMLWQAYLSERYLACIHPPSPSGLAMMGLPPWALSGVSGLLPTSGSRRGCSPLA